MPEINVPKEFKEFKICGWINFADGTSELVIRYDKLTMYTERFITINGNEYVRELVEKPNYSLYSDDCPYQTIKLPEERWKVRHDSILSNAWYDVTNVKDYIIVKNEEEKSGFSSLVNIKGLELNISDSMEKWRLSVRNLCLEEENKCLLEKNNKLMGDLSEVQKNYNSLKGDITSLIDKLEAKKNEQ